MFTHIKQFLKVFKSHNILDLTSFYQPLLGLPLSNLDWSYFVQLDFRCNVVDNKQGSPQKFLKA